MLGEPAFDYDAERYMIASASVPVTAHVRQEPYLTVALRIDRALLSDAIAQMPPADVAGHAAVSSLAVHTLDARIADALSRLVALSQRPGDIAVVAPLIKREISYYLLSGPAGPALRQLASATSQLARIAAAIDMIRRGYAQPLRAADLARAAHMSLAAFYRAFNAVTHMSPLRYQKQLRLQQARRMLIAERADVAGIGATVGYESPSQFSREYAASSARRPAPNISRREVWRGSLWRPKRQAPAEPLAARHLPAWTPLSISTLVPGTAADRRGIIFKTRESNLGVRGFGPRIQRIERRQQRFPKGRQSVLDTRRLCVEDATCEKPVALQGAQSLRQHSFGDIGHRALQIVEAPWAPGEREQNQRRPLVPNVIEHAPDRTSAAIGMRALPLPKMRGYLRTRASACDRFGGGR